MLERLLLILNKLWSRKDRLQLKDLWDQLAVRLLINLLETETLLLRIENLKKLLTINVTLAPLKLTMD